MLSYFTWKSEIAEVMFAITRLVEHLATAERTGGFELAVGLLKSVGRYHRERETPYERVVLATMPLPKHEFDVGVIKNRDGDCTVSITGLPRYAGFSLSCALPPRTFLADLNPDPANDISWRARKLFAAIRQDQKPNA